jgi:dienelactone hydrolase
MKILLMLAILMVFASSTALAKIQSEVVEYRQGDTVLEGYMAYDDSFKGLRPGVLVVHDWTGVGPYVKARAKQLASLGYIAFAPDIYGKGIHPADPKEAARTAGIYKKDRILMRQRANAGLAVLRNVPQVDPSRIGAIGYCFGGTTVLELARSGADIAAVVSFHGNLDTPLPEDAKNIHGKVLVLHGGDDPFVPPAEVSAFENEMRNAAVDWQLVTYGGAVHSFTNPDSGDDKTKGAAYNRQADKRSFEAMKTFFQEVFAE